MEGKDAKQCARRTSLTNYSKTLEKRGRRDATIVAGVRLVSFLMHGNDIGILPKVVRKRPGRQRGCRGFLKVWPAQQRTHGKCGHLDHLRHMHYASYIG